MNSTDTRHVPLSPGVFERLTVIVLRVLLYLVMRPLLAPPLPTSWQRKLIGWLCVFMPGVDGVRIRQQQVGEVGVEVIDPLLPTRNAVLLYLHGGAFTLCSPQTHRAITTRLALQTGAAVWVPDYRLAPEHPYPSGLDDCFACYQHLLAQGLAPSRIVVAGDSAGGSLTLALALRLKRLGLPQPAGLMVLSPATSTDMANDSFRRFRYSDPVLRPSMMRQAIVAYGMPLDKGEHQPLKEDLAGLPPLLIHVGTIEALHDDSILLAAHARRCGVSVELEIFERLWHVPHLFAGTLATAREGIARLAQRFIALTTVDSKQYTETSQVAKDAVMMPVALATKT